MEPKAGQFPGAAGTMGRTQGEAGKGSGQGETASQRLSDLPWSTPAVGQGCSQEARDKAVAALGRKAVAAGGGQWPQRRRAGFPK